MIKFFLTACMSMVLMLCHAHSATEAYFTIHQTSHGIQVDAEFPWTIRNALLTERPDLENSVDETSFEQAFFDYIQSHFILTDANATVLPLIEVNKIQPNGHSHHANYTFVFKGHVFSKVSNTILFNISTKQKNIHTVVGSQKEIAYITTHNRPNFEVARSAQQLTYKTLILILVVMGILFWVKRKR